MPPRQISFLKHHFYHIYNRGANRESIFREDENYRFLLRRLKRYARELDISIIAYCLLPNHYHLLVRQDGDQPAGLLPTRLFNSYTKAFNQRYERSGTLFQGRYQAIEIEDQSHLLHLCRYIHANPVVHGLTESVDLWPYSNYREWIDRRAGQLIDRAFRDDHFNSVDDYIRFVQDYVRERKPPDKTTKYMLE